MSNTVKILLAVGIGFLVVLVPGTLAFLDFLEMGELEKQREAFDKQKADLQTKKNQIPGLEESAKSTIKDYYRRKKSLPTGDEVDAYVLTLGEYRSKCGIAVWELTPVKDTSQDSPDLDAPVKFAYTIKLKAKFHQIGQLLALIENWDRFIQVNTMKVTGGGKPQEIEIEDKDWPDGKRKELDGNVDLEVELGLVTYYYQDPDLAGLSAASAPPSGRRPPKKPPGGKPPPGGQPPAAAPAQPAGGAPSPKEIELLKKVEEEMAAAPGEDVKSLLDKFPEDRWLAGEGKPHVRNPFNPLEALTYKKPEPPEKIEVVGDPTKGAPIPLSQQEREQFVAVLTEKLGPAVRALQQQLESIQILIKDGSAEGLAEADEILDRMTRPDPAKENRSVIDEAEYYVQNPILLIGDLIAKDRPPIPKEDIEALRNKEHLDQIAAIRRESDRLKKELDIQSREIKRGRARRAFEQMAKAFEAREYQRVLDAYKTQVVPLSTFDDPEVREICARAAELEKKAAIRKKFVDEGIELVGVLLDKENPNGAVFIFKSNTVKEPVTRSLGEFFDVGNPSVAVRVKSIDPVEERRELPGEKPEVHTGVFETRTYYELKFEYQGEEIPYKVLNPVDVSVDRKDESDKDPEKRPK